jgi:acetoin utilization protein AcuC
LGTAFLYTDQYFDYDYGAEHPLKIERLRLTYELCRVYGLFDLPDATLVESRPATESEILRFHTPDYLELLRAASEGRWEGVLAHGLGPGDNPIFPGLWEWSCLHAGASLRAARLVLERKVQVAFNIAGGLHHAGAEQASGFCYINDPVLAIYAFLDQGLRVMYLDVDAHHGDGVQWAFYEDPRVLTISFHQDGRSLFPGTGSPREMGKGRGLGFAVNVPMLPGSDDAVFWEGFSAIVPRLLNAYQPDVIVAQLGVDAFLTDPLAALELTTNGFVKVVSFLSGCGVPWVALGGGGYNITNVARAWTLAWALMNGVELPERIPATAIELPTGEGTLEGNLRDPEHRGARQTQCAERMRESVSYLIENVLPHITSGT